jgi:hypothetical protein
MVFGALCCAFIGCTVPVDENRRSLTATVSDATLPRPAFEPSAAAAQIAIDFQASNTLGPVARCIVAAAGAEAHVLTRRRHRVAVVDGRAHGEAFQDGNDSSS